MATIEDNAFKFPYNIIFSTPFMEKVFKRFNPFNDVFFSVSLIFAKRKENVHIQVVPYPSLQIRLRFSGLKKFLKKGLGNMKQITPP